METFNSDETKIINTTMDDLNLIFYLFEQALELQGKNGYKVWNRIDKRGLQNDIINKVQYKILKGNEILCVFSIQLNDPYIWQERDKDDAVYLHRIVTNPKFKGQMQFEKVLNWAKHFAQEKKLKFVRMDTWADNKRIIDYYKLFGFEFIDNFKTPNSTQLPIQNRELNVALLEIKLDNT